MFAAMACPAGLEPKAGTLGQIPSCADLEKKVGLLRLFSYSLLNITPYPSEYPRCNI